MAVVLVFGTFGLDGRSQHVGMGRHDLVDDAYLGLQVRHAYSACVSRIASGITSNARRCVASKSTGQACPEFTAASHVRAQTHHESPAFNPGKLNRGAGVTKSLPCSFAKLRNVSLTTQHTVCEPRSLSSVLQHPSLYQPVKGSVEQEVSSVPRTLMLGCMMRPER